MVRAETPRNGCKQLIKACDEALKAKNSAIELANLGLKQCKDQNGNLSREVNDLRDSGSRFYKNPFIMTIFGAALGVVAYGLLKK